MIGRNCEVGKDSIISVSYIQDHVKVAKQLACTASPNSTRGPRTSQVDFNVQIHDGVIITDAMVCEGAVVKEGAIIEPGSIVGFKVAPHQPTPVAAKKHFIHETL